MAIILLLLCAFTYTKNNENKYKIIFIEKNNYLKIFFF